jgi:hypothetical protein
MYLHHFLQNDLYFLKDIIQDIITILTSLPKTFTITPVAKVNLEVDSWTITKATTAGSSLGFEDNICEDRPSSQSTYKINIGCPCYKASIAPNPKLLNDFEPSKEQLEKVYGGIMKEVNELRLQIASKNTLSTIDHEGKPINTNIAKVQAQNVFFWPLDDIELLIGQLQIYYLQDYGFVRIFTTHLFSDLLLKKQFRNLHMQIYQASCFMMIQTMKKTSLLGLCLHTKKAHG